MIRALFRSLSLSPSFFFTIILLRYKLPSSPFYIYQHSQLDTTAHILIRRLKNIGEYRDKYRNMSLYKQTPVPLHIKVQEQADIFKTDLN